MLKQKANQKIIQASLGILAGLVFILVQGLLFAPKVLANNTSTNCTGGVCGTESDDLPQGATGIDPSTKVNISFSVAKSDGSDVQCRTGQLYHFIVHYIGGSASNYEYTTSGDGPDVNGQFDSGTSGQSNRYSGVFYCNNNPLTGNASTINSSLGVLYSSQLMWQTPEFNQTTRVKTIGMMVIASGTSFKPNDDLTLTVQNGIDPGVVVMLNGTKLVTLKSTKNFT
jgi:hypothetical protein